MPASAFTVLNHNTSAVSGAGTVAFIGIEACVSPSRTISRTLSIIRIITGR